MGVTMMTTRLLADLQRVARLLVRDLRPRGADARPGRVLPVADRHDQVHRRRGRSTSSASTPSSRATSSSTTTRTAAPATSPSTCCSSRCSTRASSSPSSRTSRTCPRSGAKTPGGLSGDATEIFQEGLLLPPVKIKRRGEDVRGHLEDHPRQPPHAAGHLRRLPRHDRLARPGRAPPPRAASTTTGSTSCATATPELHGDRRAADAGRDRARSRTASYFFEDVIEDDGISDGDYPMKLAPDRATATR